MSEEKKTVELKDEELEKVNGGKGYPKMYCPDCGSFLGDVIGEAVSDTKLCLKCDKRVKPIVQ